jgi:hypothetical protein
MILVIQRQSMDDVTLANYCGKVSHHATVKGNVDLVAVANHYSKKIYEELITRTFF